MNRRTMLFIAVILGVLVALLGQAQPASRVFHIGYFVARQAAPTSYYSPSLRSHWLAAIGGDR